ncbi:alpha/beta fold hydrolase [Actinopolymorpha rutila]|nr:alpha/beta fold hydrolase [Actinopolymorpha rutila]
MEEAARVGRTEFAGHGISYRVVGSGPALVLVKPHGLPRIYDLMAPLSDRYTVIQIEPLGFGWSDRPSDYPLAGVHEQVLAVLNQEGVDSFVVWGYSQGGAMALAIAQATPRVTGMVAGGWSPMGAPTDAWMRRADREQQIPIASRAFWRWYRRFDWLDELAAMQCPKLVYAGSGDRPRVSGPRGIPRARDALTQRGVTLMEFGGLDHRTCNTEPALSNSVVPAVLDWLDNCR